MCISARDHASADEPLENRSSYPVHHGLLHRRELLAYTDLPKDGPLADARLAGK